MIHTNPQNPASPSSRRGAEPESPTPPFRSSSGVSLAAERNCSTTYTQIPLQRKHLGTEATDSRGQIVQRQKHNEHVNPRKTRILFVASPTPNHFPFLSVLAVAAKPIATALAAFEESCMARGIPRGILHNRGQQTGNNSPQPNIAEL